NRKWLTYFVVYYKSVYTKRDNYFRKFILLCLVNVFVSTNKDLRLFQCLFGICGPEGNELV
ncbi:MAG TPA: hypothetical protein VF941_06250, partial [Clostridia bacterium]